MYPEFDKLEIDFNSMTEISKLTSMMKIIIKEKMPTGNTQYFYIDPDDGNNQPYSQELCQAMEFYEEIGSKMEIMRSFQNLSPQCDIYYLDFNSNTMRKLNNTSNNPQIPGLYNRPNPVGLFAPSNPLFNSFSLSFPVANNLNSTRIVRKEDSSFNFLLAEIERLKSSKDSNRNLILEETSNRIKAELEEIRTPSIIIEGLLDIVKVIEEDIHTILAFNTVEVVVKIKSDSKMFLNFMEDMKIKNNITYKIVKMDNKSGPPMKFAVISGNKKTINRILDDVKSTSSIEIDETNFPPEWEPQTEDYLEFEVKQDSNEFKMVTELMSKTVNANFVKVTRIQNKYLWNNFCFEKKKLKAKGNDKERMLFHGTRTTDPSIIYKGKDDGKHLHINFIFFFK
jgi:hypothetical protein